MLVESYRIEESKTHKAFRSPVFNNTFDKLSGFTARWGVTEDDDPDFSHIGMLIADIELSAAIHGDVTHPERVIVTEGACRESCGFCYKSNNKGTHTAHMTLDTLKRLVDKFPHVIDGKGNKSWLVNQIAYGLINNPHPQLWDIFEYTRSVGIIPNYTISGEITPEIVENTK